MRSASIPLTPEAARGIATYSGGMQPDAAEELAREHLAQDLPRRWAHVRGVAEKAQLVAHDLDLPAEVLVSAAWLHDIGYAPGIAATGFHPLDGARFLRGIGVDERVVGLVAHHSCATIEASERGLEEQLRDEFEHRPGELSDALWFCDMTVGPSGESLEVADRLAEIRTRYGPDHIVTKFINRAQDEICAAAARTEDRLQAAAVN